LGPFRNSGIAWAIEQPAEIHARIHAKEKIMSTPVPAAAGPVADLDAAHRAHAAATTPRTDSGASTQAVFLGQLSFLLTVGYITQDQSLALLNWYQNKGATPLPSLPDPPGIPGPSMYEIVTTSIHFNTPAGAMDPATHSFIGDFFDAVAGAVTDIISTTLDGITSVLQQGTALVQAGSVALGQLHDLIAVA
jgi:hypothetical protein